MRHRKKGRKLGRNTNQRKALFRSLIGHLIIKGEIKTTQAKAKAIKGLTDRLVNQAKQSTLHVRRQILAFLSNKAAANKLVDVIAPVFKHRSGGVTRIIRLGRRRGDNAEMVKVEFVDKIPEQKLETKKVKAAKPVKSAPAGAKPSGVSTSPPIGRTTGIKSKAKIPSRSASRRTPGATGVKKS